MKILIAVDGSEFTRRALDYLVEHEWLRKGHELTVLTAVPPLPHRAAAFVAPSLVHDYYQDDAEQVLGPVREYLELRGLEAVYESAVGHAADVIARTAHERRSDLIVMGSHGHGALGNVVLGSVATRVLASCGTPVLLIR